jgi:hypothetical protein
MKRAPKHPGSEAPKPLKMIPAWEGCGKSANPNDATQAPSNGSANPLSVSESDEAAVRACYVKRTLAQYLTVSIRTLDRAAAMGLLPCPDMVVGRSPRWSLQTIERWLKTRPKLPGRGGHQ